MAMTKKPAATVKLGSRPAATAGKEEAATTQTTTAEAPAAPKTRTPPPPVEDHSEGSDHEEHEEAAEVAATTTTAMAPRAGTSMAPTSHGGALKGTESAEPDGFEDLEGEIGFGSFPIMTLQNGKFSIDGVEIGVEIDVIMQQSRAKHLYKEGGVEETDYLVYSYDEVHDTGGRLLESIFEEWAEQDIPRDKIEHKKYSEAVALVIAEGEYKGQLVLLSIPPASIKRFAGYRTELKVLRKGATPQQVVTRLCIGKTVKKEKKTFNPWNFKYVRRATEADMEAAFAGLDEGDGDDE